MTKLVISVPIAGKLYCVLHSCVIERESGMMQFAPLAVGLSPGKIREPELRFVSAELSVNEAFGQE